MPKPKNRSSSSRASCPTASRPACASCSIRGSTSTTSRCRQAELVEAVKTADVLVPTVTDRIDAALLAGGRRQPQADRQFRQWRRQYRRRPRDGARHHRHQHAGRADRRHRRHDHGADPRGAAPARRRRERAAPADKTGRLVADLDAGPPHLPASGSASSAWAASARRWRAAPRRSACRSTITTGAASRRQIEEELRGDLLGKPRPDAGAHGHRLGQLPAHAGDLSSALGAAAEADEAAGLSSSTPRAARSSTRTRSHACSRRARSPAPASTCSSTSRRSIRSWSKLAATGNVVLLPHMGSATIEGRIDMGEKVIVNIKTFMDGHKPPDRVLPSML